MIHFDVVVVVPRLPFAVPHLHEADAALDQPPGDQDLPGLHARPVHVEDMLRLAAHVEGFGRVALHLVGQLERLNARFERRVGRPCGQVPRIQLLHQVELGGAARRGVR